LDPVSPNEYKIFRELRFQLDLASFDLIASDQDDVAYCVSYVYRGFSWWAILCQASYAIHDVPGTIGVSDYALQRLICTIDIRRLLRKPSPTGVTTANQASQRLIELMCDRRGQLAKNCDAAISGELSTSLKKLIL
jgi:hypothetical protein